MNRPLSLSLNPVGIGSVLEGAQDPFVRGLRWYDMLALLAGRFVGLAHGASVLRDPAVARRLSSATFRTKLRRAVEVMEPWIACNQALAWEASEFVRGERLEAWDEARSAHPLSSVLYLLAAGALLLLELFLWFAIGFLWGLAVAARAASRVVVGA